MTHLHKIAATAAVSTLVGFSAMPAAAATLQTDVDINLPSIVILYCFDELNVTVDGAGLLTALGGDADIGDPAVQTEAAVLGTATWTADFTGLTTEDPLDVDANVNLDLTGVCAIRAIGAAQGVSISVDKVDGDLLNATDAAAKIVVGDPLVRDGGATAGSGAGAFAASPSTGPTLAIPANQLGFGRLRFIDVELPLDLTDAYISGDYSGAANTFEVEALAKP